MAADQKDAGGVGSPLLDGRFLIEIDSWEANLHVGLASSLTPREYQFQGGLAFRRSFDLKGLVVAPRVRLGTVVRVHFLPFGPELRFGEGELEEVGQVLMPSPGEPTLKLTLLVPEAALPLAAICLSTTWKYLHVWAFDEEDGRAGVSAFFFSSEIHENLRAWIAGV